MKNVSKTKTILALTAITLLLFGFINKSNTDGGILTMRVTESRTGGVSDNSINIVYEDGKRERIELDKLKGKDLARDLGVINKTLNDIANKGYKLVSTAGIGEPAYWITTYTFVKE